VMFCLHVGVADNYEKAAVPTLRRLSIQDFGY